MSCGTSSKVCAKDAEIARLREKVADLEADLIASREITARYLGALISIQDITEAARSDEDDED